MNVPINFSSYYTYMVGVGLQGQPPHFLQNLSRFYIMESVTLFIVSLVSNYAESMGPSAGKFWSIMCEFTLSEEIVEADAIKESMASLMPKI